VYVAGVAVGTRAAVIVSGRHHLLEHWNCHCLPTVLQTVAVKTKWLCSHGCAVAVPAFSATRLQYSRAAWSTLPTPALHPLPAPHAEPLSLLLAFVLYGKKSSHR